MYRDDSTLDKTECYLSSEFNAGFNDGDDISPGLFIVWLHKILDRAGLPRVTLHSLRHTNITLQLANGVDMKTVSIRVGYSKASTTSDFYSHFLKTPDQHASATIDKIFE